MKVSRRDLVFSLTALAISQAGSAEQATLAPKAYRFEDLPVRTRGANSFRSVFEGNSHSGVRVELHETDLAPGEMPHPPHHHVHEELFLVREGTVEVTLTGDRTRLGPGSVAFIASDVEHGIRNVGATRAQYFVLALDRNPRPS